MNSTSQLTHVFDYAPERATLFEEIWEWIECNTFSSDQSYVWQVGISTGPSLNSITSKVLRDIECKHFRCWEADTFKKAIGVLSRLNKQRFVFKSELSNYAGKGHHLFIYKTSCSTKSLFYHTLHH